MRAPRLITQGLLLLAIFLATAGCGRERSTERPDILLVTIDTLRADRVGCYGYTAARTPTFDRLASEGVRYEFCQSPAPITLPSHATILTGQLPAQHGARNNLTYRLPEQVPTLAELLQQDGYITGAFVAALPLAARFGLDRGFETYDDELPEREKAAFYFAERPASAVVEAATRWLSEQPDDRPVFAWVHFFEPHLPYALLPELETEFALRPYDGEVAAADLAMDALLRAFDQQRGRARLTMLTSDHGEGLEDHGEPTHTLLLFEETQRVPLIVHWPDHVPAGAVEREPVGLIDLAPTLLSLAGIDPGPLQAEGIVLDPGGSAPERRDLMAETLNPLETYGWSPSFALRNGPRKVIRSAISRAYRLDTDPGERTNLLEQNPAPGWTQEMLQRIDARIRSMRPPTVGDVMRQPTEDEREALAALGYVSGAMSTEQHDPDALLATMKDRPDATQRMEEFLRTEEARYRVEQGDFTGATEILHEVVRAGPTNVKAWSMLGGAEQELGNMEAAVEAFAKAVEGQPDWLAPHVNLARIHERAGRHEAALVHYYRMLDLEPRNIQWVRETSACLLALGRAPAAVQVLEDAARQQFGSSDRSWIHGGLAHLLLQMNQVERGAGHLETARAAQDGPELALLATQYLERQDRREEARANLERALRAYPDHAGLRAKASEYGLR